MRGKQTDQDKSDIQTKRNERHKVTDRRETQTMATQDIAFPLQITAAASKQIDMKSNKQKDTERDRQRHRQTWSNETKHRCL